MTSCVPSFSFKIKADLISLRVTVWQDFSHPTIRVSIFRTVLRLSALGAGLEMVISMIDDSTDEFFALGSLISANNRIN